MFQIGNFGQSLCHLNNLNFALMSFAQTGCAVMATENVNNEVSVGEIEELETSNGIEKLEISNGNDEVSENSSSMQKDEDGGIGDEFVVG